MIDWRPIETVPLDRPIMLTDGLIFGAAERNSWTEISHFKEWNGKEFVSVPNPKAGQINYYWSPLAGWTVINRDVEWEDGEYEQRSPKSIKPTHWAELPQLPERRTGKP